MRRDDQPSDKQRRAAPEQQTGAGASRAPGKRPLTGGTGGAAGGAVQRKAAASTGGAAAGTGESSAEAGPDWTPVVWRPDLYTEPAGAVVQRKADAATSGVAQTGAGQTGAPQAGAPQAGAPHAGAPQADVDQTGQPGQPGLETGNEVGLDAPTTQQVEQAIDNGDPPGVILQRIAELAAQHPGWPLDCWSNGPVMNKILGALSGDQVFRAFQLMDMPPANDDRAYLRFLWVSSSATQASVQTFRAIFATEPEARQNRALREQRTSVWLQVLGGADPLALFRHLQTGLNADAATHVEFFQWMVAQSTPAQILRSLTGAPDPVKATAAGHLNAVANGWDWLDNVAGANLLPPEQAALTTIRATANPTGQAKIDVLTNTAGPPAPQQGFGPAMTALRTAGAAQAQILALMQTGTAAERLVLLDDPVMVAFIHGACPGHPLHVYNVAPNERADFLQKTEFAKLVLARADWAEALGLVTDRAYIDRLGATLDAISAQLAVFLAAMPAADMLSAPEQMSVRALRLVITNAANQQTIYNHFGDQQYPDAWAIKNPAPITPEAMETPLVTLDRLLGDPAPSGDEIVSMCGAAGGDRPTIAGDPARMALLRAKTTDEHFFHAIVALRMTLAQQIAQLGLKGHTPERLQTLLVEADAASIDQVVRDAAAVRALRADLPNQPLNLLRYDAPGALPAFVMDHAEIRAWVLTATSPPQLLAAVGATQPIAAQFAPKFDAHGWGWLARVPAGAALLPDERTALAQLSAASGDAAAQGDIAAKLGDQTDVVADAPTALAELKTEIAKPTASASRCMALVTQLTDPAHRQDIATNHRADALRVLDEAQLGRFMQSLALPIAEQLRWMRDKGAPGPATLQMLLSRAPGPDKAALFDDPDAIPLLMASTELGPVRTMGGMDPATLATVAGKQRFWEWFVAKERPLELLHGVVATARIDPSINTIKTAGLLGTFDQLPRGTGLTPTHRGYADQIMHGTADGDAQQKMFVARFDVSLTGDWTVTTPDDLLRLYDELATLPIAHVTNDRMLRIMNRHHAGGGTYAEGQRQANIGSGTGNDETFYTGQATQYVEKYFDHTVRHEVGHAVDAFMGGKTDIVFNQAGWNEYSQSQLEDWITAMNGWDAAGGPAPTPADKQQIRDLIQEYLQAGGGTIAGPSQPAQSLAGADHPWSRFPHVRVVREINRATTGMSYQNRATVNNRVFSINYYYRRFMECSQVAGANVPRDYTMFAPAEWFADMYAEFYRPFDGVDDSQLGGNVPGWVRTWFLNNVHRVGGRSPHDMTGVQTPEPQRINH